MNIPITQVTTIFEKVIEIRSGTITVTQQIRPDGPPGSYGIWFDGLNSRITLYDKDNKTIKTLDVVLSAYHKEYSSNCPARLFAKTFDLDPIKGVKKCVVSVSCSNLKVGKYGTTSVSGNISGLYPYSVSLSNKIIEEIRNNEELKNNVILFG